MEKPKEKIVRYYDYGSVEKYFETKYNFDMRNFWVDFMVDEFEIVQNYHFTMYEKLKKNTHNEYFLQIIDKILEEFNQEENPNNPKHVNFVVRW